MSADPMDRMQVDVNLGSHAPHTPGSVPPVARRIIPADYVPDEGEVLPETVVVPPAPETAIEQPPVVVPDPDPAPVVVPTVNEPPKIFEEIEEWQAKDENGVPVGPPSKIIGRGATQVEALRDLAAKLRDANIHAARKIREYRQKARTNYDPDTLGAMAEVPLLTAERRAEITKLMKDPATVDEAYVMLYESQFGETPDQARARLQRERQAAWVAEGNRQTNIFLEQHPDFPKGSISKKLLLDEVQLRKNAAEAEGKTFGWTAHNLEIVYDDLVERGTLVPLQLQSPEPAVPGQIAPTTRASQETTPPSASPANPPAVAANTASAPGTRPRGTRFSSLSTEHGQAPNADTTRRAEDEAFRKEVAGMSPEEFKRKIRERKFYERYNALRLT
jgi:hypothetical protein